MARTAVKSGHIKDLVPDAKNRRKRTARNLSMMVDSLQRVGAARSIVIDEDNSILAGNGLIDAAAEAGITKMQVVEADGETIVAVRRRGLNEAQKRALAIYDNRAGELAEWDVDQLAADAADGLPLVPFFEESELRKLTKPGREATVAEVPTSEVRDQFWIVVRGPLAAQAKALQRLRDLMHEIEHVEVSLGTAPSEDWMPIA